MSPMLRRWWWLAACALAACRQEAPPAPPAREHVEPTGALAVPETVRRNLGIEFARVERRRVAQTLRVPGHFELLPAARREHRVPLAGRVEVLVRPLQSVGEGDLLFRLDSPGWRDVQRELGELATAVQVAEARFAAMQPLAAAHVVHEKSLEEAIRVIEARVQSLDETRASVGGQAQELAAARVQLAQVRAALAEAAEKGAETEAATAEVRANLAAGRDRFELALRTAATLVALEPEGLRAEDAGLPGWRAIRTIDGRAMAAGAVDRLPVATGAWVDTGDLVVSVTDVSRVRFRARGLQSDLLRLRAGLPAQVVLPGESATAPRLTGSLELGVEADPAQRTIDLFLEPVDPAAWARPGVAAFLEVETAGGAAPELAVPLSAVARDGVHRVVFRRDPADPDKVLRVEAELGIDDGRWVEVKSGLRDGDEVVVAGAYELVLARPPEAEQGGHFHADGTFHPHEQK
jgi:multidrug efflux pump subunit AcrA (membrane-fusion protein)